MTQMTQPSQPGKPTILHLLEMSSDLYMSDREALADYRWVVRQGADVIGITETLSHRAQVKAAAKGRYKVFFFEDYNELAILVRYGLKVAHTGSELVDPGQSVDRHHPIGHPNRYISWVCVDVEGNEVWSHLSHWNQKVSRAPGVPEHNDRLAGHVHNTREMVRLVNAHAQGGALGFFMGDINVDEHADDQHDFHDFPDYIFHQGGLTTVYDELHIGRQVGTEGKLVYDIIGKADQDARVTAHRYLIHPKQHTDHRPVSVWYAIAPKVHPS